MKIADAVERALTHRARSGAAGVASGRLLAEGDGWSVHDVVCSCSPGDRPFEEQHEGAAIALVVAGTFQYSTSSGRALMTPGSLLLGTHGESFICTHEYASGDRCVSFRYSPAHLEALLSGADLRRPAAPFDCPRLPALPGVSPDAARVCANLLNYDDGEWEELSVRVAVRVARLLRNDQRSRPPASAAIERRVTEMVRLIEREPARDWTLAALARQSGVSTYRFLRTFEQTAGVSPHQYVMRMRLRDAATRLGHDATKIVDLALDCGFNDVSNFNHAFKREFGVSPRGYRGGGRRM